MLVCKVSVRNHLINFIVPFKYMIKKINIKLNFSIFSGHLTHSTGLCQIKGYMEYNDFKIQVAFGINE